MGQQKCLHYCVWRFVSVERSHAFRVTMLKMSAANKAAQSAALLLLFFFLGGGGNSDNRKTLCSCMWVPPPRGPPLLSVCLYGPSAGTGCSPPFQIFLPVSVLVGT